MPSPLKGAPKRCRDPKAGTITGYRRHMAKRKINKKHRPCEACRLAAAIQAHDYSRRRVLNGARPSYDNDMSRHYRLVGGEIMVDSTGTKRRLQALAVIGYGWVELNERTGMSPNHLRDIAAGRKPRVRRDTEAKVTAIYDELSMHPPALCRRVKIVRGRIAKYNWASPLGWDDGSIGDPNAWPVGMSVGRTRNWLIRYGTPEMLDAYEAQLVSTG